jgi:hypothetical protein
MRSPYREDDPILKVLDGESGQTCSDIGEDLLFLGLRPPLIIRELCLGECMACRMV